VNTGANILSTAVVYDGGHVVHVLTNGQDGKIVDRPFDTATNSYKNARVLDTGGGTVSGVYVGTGGVSGMMDQGLALHLAYWSASGHILYRSYTYNLSQDVLTLVDGPTQLDSAGSANHPALAVSPKYGSVTVVWVSQAGSPAKILARTRKSGAWGSIETVSSAPVWTSTSAGINIDQGPGLVISADGALHLSYIEDWRVSAPYDYGRIHYAVNSGAGWSDTFIGSYSHDPAVAVDSTGQVTILGHGYPLNSACTSMQDVCIYAKGSGGAWAAPRVFLAHQGSLSFDSSPSVKWSSLGLNRPDIVEFTFAEVSAGYNNPVLYYGRIGPDVNLDIKEFLPFLQRFMIAITRALRR
jgi:hypothetical protein